MINRAFLLITVLLCFGRVWCVDEPKPATITPEASRYLFVWAGDAARVSTDFLAVIDAQPSSPAYGRIVSSAPVELTGTMPHHTEYEFPKGNRLIANGWAAGRTFIFDLSDPLRPRVARKFQDRDGYSFAHSFVRLPNGHVLATFQSHGEGYAPGGGLVELDENGSVIRSASALDPAVDKDLIWPYSLAVAPQLDRVVSSSTLMGWPEWAKLPEHSWPLKKINDYDTAQVQIWRLSDLRLLNTVTLPADSAKHNEDPAEPRLLPDGSVYVNTFRCGLYRMKDVDGARPSAELVYTFPGGDNMHTMCAVPVVVGHYWIQTVAALPGLIALDIRNPEKPVEVSRLTLDPQFAMPHWLAADRKSDRLVITGDQGSWVLVARFDTGKGALSLDQSFREPGADKPGISFDRQQWPHGKAGRAIVHGALFGPQ
jgi:hypothetical protein